MSEVKDELDPPFEILEPAEWRGPVVFNSPHSGSVYPHAFLTASRLDVAALRRSEDSFVDELSLGVVRRGYPLMRAHFPRCYVDVNREPYELDPRMFEGRLPSFANTRSMRVAGGLGTVARAWMVPLERSSMLSTKSSVPCRGNCVSSPSAISTLSASLSLVRERTRENVRKSASLISKSR